MNGAADADGAAVNHETAAIGRDGGRQKRRGRGVADQKPADGDLFIQVDRLPAGAVHVEIGERTRRIGKRARRRRTPVRTGVPVVGPGPGLRPSERLGRRDAAEGERCDARCEREAGDMADATISEGEMHDVRSSPRDPDIQK